jgi:hypothetical protein
LNSAVIAYVIIGNNTFGIVASCYPINKVFIPRTIQLSKNLDVLEKLSVNSLTGPFSIFLPQNPAQFEEIIFADHYTSWGTNNVTISRNGSLIENLADDLVLNTTWPNQIILRFEGSTWRVYAII